MENSPGAVPRRGHALILATSEYQDPQLAALRLPGVDLAALGEVLSDPNIGHFEVADIPNGPCQELKARIGSFFSNASADETLLLYIAGHAVKDLDGEIYIAATDTRLDQLPWTGIDSGFIQKVAGRSPCRRLLMILDTCFSGVFPAEHAPRTGEALAVGVQERFRDSAGMVLITPTGEIQYGFRGGSVDTHSEPALLSKQIIDGLSTGKADFQDDGQITAEELFRYVLLERRLDGDTGDVDLQRRQPQHWSFNLEGDLTVASNAMLRASAFSKDLVELIENVSFRARLLAVEDLASLLSDQSASLARAARGALEHLQSDPDPRVSQVATTVLQKAAGPSASDGQTAGPGGSPPGTSPRLQEEIAEGGKAQEDPSSPVLHRSGITTWLLRYFQSDLAVDLGVTNTVIYHGFDRRVVLDEPSMLTVERVRDQEWNILAVGSEAKSMLGRTPEAVQAVRPMKDGVIADFFFAERMLRYFMTKVLGSHVVRPSPRVLMCIPFSSTPVERHTFRECVERTGARKVLLVNKSMAAAIGAGLPVSEARASVVLHVGGAISEVAVLSLARIIFASSARLGGDHFDQAIMSYVREKHGVLIGEATAEQVKMTAGAARRGEEARTVTVKGRNPSEAALRTVVLSSDDIADALQEPIQALMNLLKDALHQTPPELLADAAERGIVLTGGGALLRGLDKLLAEKTGVSVTLAEDPTTCVARGAGRIFELLDQGGHHHFDLE